MTALDLLVTAITATAPDPAGYRLGVVAAVSPFTVKIAGEAAAVPLPVVGPIPPVGALVVIAERAQGDLVVLGAINTGSGLVTLAGASNEKLRLLAGSANAFLSFYNSAGTTREGFLQSVPGGAFQLVRETAGSVSIVANSGTVVLSGTTVSVSNLAAVNGAGIQYPGATVGGGSANAFGVRWSSPNMIGVVDNVVSATIGTASDRRIKADITDWDGSDVIDALRPVSYRPREFAVDADGKLAFHDQSDADVRVGLIADEVERVAPWAVNGEASDTSMQSVDYPALVVPLISRVHRLTAQVAAQAEQITALEARLARLEAAIA